VEKRIKDYLRKIAELLNDTGPEDAWEDLLLDHLCQIGFFQHERLIHLIVTVTFALVMFMMLILLLLTDQYLSLILAVFIFVAIMLLLYIRHYYILETSVQKMYEQYDEIQKRKSKQKVSQ